MAKNLNAKITIGGVLSSSFKAAVGSANSNVKGLGNTMAELNRRQKRLSKISSHWKKMGRDTSKFQKELKRVNFELGKTQNKIQSITRKSKMPGLGKGIAAAGLAFGVGRLFGGAMDLEEQGLYLGTVINAKDGDKTAAIQRARKHAAEFAGNSLATESEVLDIEYALNSAGISEEASRAGTELVHKLSTVTKGAAGQVGEILGVTFNNLGKNIAGTTEEKMKAIGNVLAKTQFKFQIRDFGQLGESLKYAASSAASAKVPLEQMSVVIGQLNSAGLMGSMAGTAFSGVLRKLTKASEEIGFEIIRDEGGQLDLIGTLEKIKEMTDDLSVDDKSDLFQRLFGDEGKRGLVPLLEGIDSLKAANEEMQQVASGSLIDDEYQAFLGSSKGQWKQLTQNIRQVGHAFANVLLPSVNAILTPLAEIGKKLSLLIQKSPKTAKSIGVVGAVLVGALTTGKVAMIAFNVALRSNPLGWLITAFTALGSLVFWVYKNWDNLTGFVSEKWQGLKNGFVSEKWQGLKNLWFGKTNRTIGLGAGAGVGSAISKMTSESERAENKNKIPGALLTAGNKTVNSTVNNSINITQMPGEDQEMLAKRVAKELEKKQKTDALSSFLDQSFAF